MPGFTIAVFFLTLAVLLGLILTRAVARNGASGAAIKEMAGLLETSIRQVCPATETLAAPFAAAALKVRWAADETRPDQVDEIEILLSRDETLWIAGPFLGGTMPARFDIPPPRGLAALFRPAPTGIELFDAACSFRAQATMASLVRALADEGRLVEPIVILRRLAGVRAIHIETGAETGRAGVRLSSADLLRKPEDLESLLHNLVKVGRLLRAA